MFNETKTNKARIRTFLAGAVASILATLLSQPFEVVKINQQLGNYRTNSSLIQNRKSDSIITIFRTIFKNEGLRGFWKGHSGTQLLGILHGITLFCTYEESLRFLSKAHYLKSHNYKIIYLSGFLSGTYSVLLLSPIDLVNTRCISKISDKKKPYKASLYRDLKKIVKTEGFTGLYRGGFVNWAQVSNLVALKFYIYNRLCAYISDSNIYSNKKELHSYILVGCGAVSGIAASILTFPIEVIKRKIQIRNAPNNEDIGTNVCITLRTCGKFIFKTQGIKGFYKGLLPSVLKSSVITAVVFSCYDIVSYLLDQILITK